MSLRSWTPEELAAIEEARRKLRRSVQVNAGIAIAGVLVTVVTFVAGQAGFILAYGPIIAGPLLAFQAHRRLKKVDLLQPGTPLNAAVLGVRTSIDPPRPSQRKASSPYRCCSESCFWRSSLWLFC